MKKIILLIFLLMLSNVYASNQAEQITIHLTPKNSSGDTQASKYFLYEFNFTNSSDCLTVIIQDKVTLTTDKQGRANRTIDFSSVTTTPEFLCEYRNASLRKVHTMNQNVFEKFINLSGDTMLGNFTVNQGNVTINHSMYFPNGICIGRGCIVDSLTSSLNYASTVIGFRARSYGNKATVIGDLVFNNASSSVVIGGGNTVTSPSVSTADAVVGVANVVDGWGHNVLGFNNDVFGFYNIVIGTGNYVEGEESIILSTDGEIRGNRSIAIGVLANASTHDCIAIGYNASCNKTGDVVFSGDVIVTQSPMTLAPGNDRFMVLNDSSNIIEVFRPINSTSDIMINGSSVLTTLDDTWVNETGDNMTGDLNINANLYVQNYSTLNGAVGFNWYDDGSELFLNVSQSPDAFNIESENSKFVMFNDPNAGNDYKTFQFFSKEASDTTELILYKAGAERAMYQARSLRIGGPEGSSCFTGAPHARSHIDCNTSITGADIIIFDGFFNMGNFSTNNGSVNISSGNIHSNTLYSKNLNTTFLNSSEIKVTNITIIGDGIITMPTGAIMNISTVGPKNTYFNYPDIYTTFGESDTYGGYFGWDTYSGLPYGVGTYAGGFYSGNDVLGDHWYYQYDSIYEGSFCEDSLTSECWNEFHGRADFEAGITISGNTTATARNWCIYTGSDTALRKTLTLEYCDSGPGNGGDLRLRPLNDKQVIIQEYDSTPGDLNVTGNITTEAVLFKADRANHKIYDNTTCIIIEGDTSTLSIC